MVPSESRWKGRSAKQGQKEEKQVGNHVEGGNYGDDGEHGDTLLSDASCHRAARRARACHCMTICMRPTHASARTTDQYWSVPECGRAPSQIEPSPPLKVADIVKPRNGRSSLSEPEWQVISYFRP